MHPILRQPASRLMKANELERLVLLARRKLGGPGGVFVLLDSEDQCPAIQGPELLARIRSSVSDIPTSIVLAHREYESWFLAAARSLPGKSGLPLDFEPHPAPESVRGCKEWLSGFMPRGCPYSAPFDQPKLTAAFDFDLAAKGCSSFEKCHRELLGLLWRVAESTPGFQLESE